MAPASAPRKHATAAAAMAAAPRSISPVGRGIVQRQAARDAHKKLLQCEDQTNLDKFIRSSRFVAYVPEKQAVAVENSVSEPAAADLGAGPFTALDDKPAVSDENPILKEEAKEASVHFEADSLEEDDEDYMVLYCEHFDLSDGSMVDFCVRRYPEFNGINRYTVTIGCVTCSGDAPVLLWDVWSSIAFEWVPPPTESLPRSSGGLHVDPSRRCLVSRFGSRMPGNNRWQVVLDWPGPYDDGLAGHSRAPRGVSAQILCSNDRVLRHPCGQCFVVPVRGELDVAAALPCAFKAVPALQSQTWRSEIPSIQLQLWDGIDCDDCDEADRCREPPEDTKFLLASRDKDHKVQALEIKLSGEQAHRRRLHEELMNLKSRIRVFCRIRGGSVCHKESGVRCEYPSAVHLSSLRRSFQFDLSFGPETDTSEIFLEARPLVDSVVDRRGGCACILCYGQTGAGKTFTMEGPSNRTSFGTQRQCGLIEQTLERLFTRVAELHETEAPQIGVSMIEIYQEQPFDLLHERVLADGASGAAGPPPRIPLVLRSGKACSAPVVPGLVVAKPMCKEEAIDLYKDAVQARRVGCSERNAQSSRSHLLFTVHLQWPGEGAPEGRLALVDLAGSERQSSGSVHDKRRIDEARAINRSLTTLAKVVRECGARKAPSQTNSEPCQRHVPYRDSVLTRLLCDCIGGRARTLFIVHASPEECDVPETLCTLQFGVSAKRVRTQQECEQCKGGRSQRRIDRLSEENYRLRRELVKERRQRRRLCAAVPDADQIWSRLRSPHRPNSQASSSSPDKEIKTGHGQTCSEMSVLDQCSVGSLSPTFASESPTSSQSMDRSFSPDTRRRRARTSPAKVGELRSTKESKENRCRHTNAEKSSCCNTNDKNAKENKGCRVKNLLVKHNQKDADAFRPALREVTTA
eukprot:gnl/MRDRNA2_/MRDRNA2_34194_c0_seq1.p1 gnl/MRDRNA2_/MRDRNA2_34194_c0~~gnl/MRDRNA2_/MRDRNA2_34194_c0_seq1.p1  ORF type:complete len:928 (-),score=116.85 gnl/MRDRNA2_/MRDRNA2_34194_c0_seq1:11-2761(-)